MKTGKEITKNDYADDLNLGHWSRFVYHFLLRFI